MNEFVASVVTILKKGNLIIALLSVAVAILVYKRYDDWLWAIFSLCITCYLVLQFLSFHNTVLCSYLVFDKELNIFKSLIYPFSFL